MWTMARVLVVDDEPAVRRALERALRLENHDVTLAEDGEQALDVLADGSQDAVIPVAHARVAAELAPGATVEVIEDAGHFPHKDHPQQFVRILDEFVRTHPAAAYHRGRWRALLRNGPDAPVPEAVTAAPQSEFA